MKKTLFFLLLITSLYHASAQQKLTEGVVEFDILYPELPSDMVEYKDKLPMKMKVYFKGGKCRYDMSTDAGPTASITNMQTRETILLMDMMGKKMAIRSYVEKQGPKSANAEDAMKDEGRVMLMKDEKTVAGYHCKKAIVYNKVKGQVKKFECYYTTELPTVMSSNTTFSKNTNIDIPGFMMDYTVLQNGLNMHMVAKAVRAEKVDDMMFTVPTDYGLMTMEQLMKQFSGSDAEEGK